MNFNAMIIVALLKTTNVMGMVIVLDGRMKKIAQQGVPNNLHFAESSNFNFVTSQLNLLHTV